MAAASLNFKLQDKNGKVFTLDSFKGYRKVVYFYPKDDTPGCTIETKSFDSMLPKFIANKTAVIGISGGDNKSKAKFCKKHNLKLPLLSDPSNKIAKSYGAFGNKVFMGRKFKGILRNTYVLDEKNKLMKSYEGVKPEGHAAEVLKFVAKNVPVVEVKAEPVKKVTKKATTKTVARNAAKPAMKSVKSTSKKSPSKKAAPKKAAPKKVVAKKGAAKTATQKAVVKKAAPRKTIKKTVKASKRR